MATGGTINNPSTANTLTGLIPDAYSALNVVSQELVGVIPGVTRDGTMDRAAVGQNVRVPVPPAANVVDITPGMTVPDPTAQTIAHSTMVLQKSRAAEFGYTGIDKMRLDAGPGYMSVQAQQIAEGLRALVNEIEKDLACEAVFTSSRAVGTAGTAPFAGEANQAGLSGSAGVRKILDDNGAPHGMRTLAISTSAGANLRNLSNLTRLNESGEMSMLRQGALGELHGSMVRESGQAYSHVKGTASGRLVNGVQYGTTEIAVDGGSGTIKQGDVVTFAGDTNRYVVNESTVGASGTGNITIGKPGLLAQVADNTQITLADNYTANVNFAKSALILAMRLPEIPEEGDIAIDRFTMMDPRSMLVFEIAAYPGYRQNRYEVSATWGVKGIKPEHSAVLLG